MDTLTESVDFEHQWMPAFALGYKALAVNLSDLAAMGAKPRFALMSITLNKKRFAAPADQAKFFKEFSRGFASCAKKNSVELIGGDLGSSRRESSITVCALGQSSKGGRVLTRSGARAGDLICVAGELGMARRGLRALMGGLQASRTELAAFRFPKPLVALSEDMVSRRLARAGMDISDGLSRDLERLGKINKLGFEIDLSGIRPGLRPDAWVGGEDYALLLAVAPRKVSELKKLASKHRCRFHCLGRFIKDPIHREVLGLSTSANLDSKRFEHF
jgi:thiamine-monophosphate kinase